MWNEKLSIIINQRVEYHYSLNNNLKSKDHQLPILTTMKVLLIGATGNLGARLVPALLMHGHRVVTFVRSSSKLESILPATVFQQIKVVEGDATNSASIKHAILENECDAVVSAAGVAAMAPWERSELPKIFKSILNGVVDAGAERGRPLRVWFMGGLSVLYYPGTETMLSS